MEINGREPNPRGQVFTAGQRQHQLAQQLNFAVPNGMATVNGVVLSRMVTFLSNLEVGSLALCAIYNQLSEDPQNQELGQLFFNRLQGLQQLAATSMGLVAKPPEEEPPPSSRPRLVVP